MIWESLICSAFIVMMLENALGNNINSILLGAYHTIHQKWVPYLSYNHRYGRKCPICGHTEVRRSTKMAWYCRIKGRHDSRCMVVSFTASISLYIIMTATIAIMLSYIIN